MKNARQPALDTIEPLLVELRKNPALKEKTRGVFYCRSRPCVHFHEDASGMFADVRVADSWERVGVNSVAERRALVEMLESIPLRRAPK